MVIQGKVKCFFFACGEGKRLRPLSYYFQKCMIPIGKMQKPLLEYIIRLVQYHGITDVTMLVGYKHEQIMNYFGDGSRFGIHLSYIHDPPSIKGTGAALLHLYQERPLDFDGSILIYYGDILSNIDLTELMVKHQKKKAAATLALAHGYQVPVGVAEVEGEMVTHWVEKPRLDFYAGIGILALDSQSFGDLLRLTEDHKELDITRDLIPYIVNSGKPIYAYITDSFWYDVGSLEKYEKLDDGILERNFSFLIP